MIRASASTLKLADSPFVPVIVGSAADVDAGRLQCDLVLDAPWALGVFPLVGAVQGIADEGYTVVRCAGISAGALVAALIAAAGAAGRPLHSVQSALSHLNLGDLPWNKRQNEYLDSRYLYDFLYSELKSIDVITFGDLRISKPPGSLAPGNNNYRLVIYVMNGQTVMRLPFDYASLGLDPDVQSITQAVLASGSGTAFQPVHFASSHNLGGRDFEMADAFADVPVPVDCFAIDGHPPIRPTIAVAVQPGIASVMPASSPADLARTITVHVGRTRLLDANASEESCAKLFKLGATAAKEFLLGGAPQSATSGAATKDPMPVVRSVASPEPEVKPGSLTVPFQDIPLVLGGLGVAAMYVAKEGAPFFLRSHWDFFVDFMKECRMQTGGHLPYSGIQTASEADVRLRRLIAAPRWSLRLGIWLYLLVFTPKVLFVSAGSSAGLVLRRGIRSVPPLITAVVVVFVTSDAWRILGAGFTPRFFALVALFLVVSLLFLIRLKDYWGQDIDASDDEAADLLQGIKNSMTDAKKFNVRDRPDTKRASDKQPDGGATLQWLDFHRLIELGAKPTPLVKPVGRWGRTYVYAIYVMLSAFFLILVVLFVSGTLILVGLILISAKDTQDLAQSVDIYMMLWGHVVITRQLVSLSLSLGAFAAFFLVAAQRAEDRKELMNNLLVRLRQTLMVYAVYRNAYTRAAEWTGVPVVPDGRGPKGRRDGEDAVVVPGA
jgi:predicted acylesterase/phospholipase RssA